MTLCLRSCGDPASTAELLPSELQAQCMQMKHVPVTMELSSSPPSVSAEGRYTDNAGETTGEGREGTARGPSGLDPRTVETRDQGHLGNVLKGVLSTPSQDVE